MIKYYFNFARGNLNDKPSHQVTAGSNWSRMSFLKLPHLLDTLQPIIITPNHIAVFWNEKDSEAGNGSFVVMLYLHRVCNQWCMYFMFLLYFLFLCAFTIINFRIVNHI